DGANDRALDHSLTYALIEIGENDPLRKAVGSSDPKTRRSALIALDQIGAQLDSALIIHSLDDSDTSTRDAARWIAGHHPEWGADLVAYFRHKLQSPPESEQSQLVELLAKFAKNSAIAEFLAQTVKQASQSPAAARIALAAMAASGQKELPPSWT